MPQEPHAPAAAEIPVSDHPPQPAEAALLTASPNGAAPASAPGSGVKHRLITPLQVRGNLGKSTEAIVRSEWMNARRVLWQGFDLDQDNRTFSEAYPEQVRLVELSPEPAAELIRILRAVPQASVTSLDPRAHLHSLILDTLELVRFTEVGAAAGVRLTVLVYPLDELSDLDDLAHTVSRLGARADWVIVRNRKLQPRTRMFDGSALEQELLELGAANLEVPALLSDTRVHLRAKEVRLGRALSFAEALQNPQVGLDWTHRLVLEDWLRKLFRQYDGLAAHLLPAEDAARLGSTSDPEPVTVVGPARSFRRGAKVNLAAIE